MRFVSYQLDQQTGFGVLRGEHEIIALNDLAPDLITFIEKRDALRERLEARFNSTVVTLALADVTLLAPIPRPLRNIMCVGKNYAAHARESNAATGEEHELPPYPVFFTKAPTTANGPFADIPYDAAVSTHIDYEAELAVIVGKRGKNISRDEAFDYVFGYTVINDVSARDLQFSHKQYFKGKSLDGSCPMGPWIVTADTVPDPHNLDVRCTVNADLRQSDNTCQMMFNIPEIIFQLSRGMTLLPGDIISTGTPEGVGFARKPPLYLKPGDVVECSVEKVGLIRNRVAG